MGIAMSKVAINHRLPSFSQCTGLNLDTKHAIVHTMTVTPLAGATQPPSHKGMTLCSSALALAWQTLTAPPLPNE